eukprot:CAMPEP_0181131260 /NCGR_PEP_ID=MMETSP1071-20121207/30326_1 /TAXON_ID=35127 /ORGANISM="Thalassiosira sp., Strain NH16" /LENGTH=390 /DNA_ID=CAMNT_0023217433 /DNA_START=168 /DNA_END=1341 /DNA_ORIENTATION=+
MPFYHSSDSIKSSSVGGAQVAPPKIASTITQKGIQIVGALQLHPTDLATDALLSSSDRTLSLWVFAFASSHIGMSAVRSSVISTLGTIATDKPLDLVGNEQWVLPPWWPGDTTGGNRIFPDGPTAGRQLYRVLYTVISFVTLGSALGAYLRSSSMALREQMDPTTSLLYYACLFSASLSFGAAIASLFNASPLGLMPSFEKGTTTSSSQGNKNNVAPRAAAAAENTMIAGIRRDDTLKFTTRGLTRITRHPLILPVVPWGLATAHLAGGRACDCILFGGLSVYSVAGCLAQDLRVMREEGSVGTVFEMESRPQEQRQRQQHGVMEGESYEGERTRLRYFFEQTSFVPFKAVVDGRQQLSDIIEEGPWLQLVLGTIAGSFVEVKIIQLLEL